MATDEGLPGLSADEVRRECGELSDATVEAIIATGATGADVAAALAWEQRSFEVRTGEDGLSGPAAEVRRILDQDAAWAEDPERGG